ncbi:PTS system, cellobiose-specific IIC component [Selenomonas ruminantium]|uniref:Permease IIC component n=1 Tax=Selenomonas ruminantium TaxID=971 RepID=A0A1M6S6G6_SELRU|nr:PTS transporter subunit EIIC [Selenomonas ruminantium]SHK40285.1 PTS system, cellobiose-specific IIC component [Selenomonas ruminantium]
MGKHLQWGGILDSLIIPISHRLRKISYLRAIRDTFCLLMPVIIVLTLLHMIGFLLCNPNGPLLGADGLGLGSLLTGGLHDQAYRESAFFAECNRLKNYLEVTNILASLLFALVLTLKLAALWQGEKILALICTVSSYLFLITAFPGNAHELTLYFSVRGFFLALLISTFSTLLFSYLSRLPRLQLTVIPGLPKEMAVTLRFLLPLTFTLLASLMAALSWMSIEESALSLPAVLANVMGENIPQSPVAAVCYEFVRRFLWWLGLNGNSLTCFWNEAFYIPAQLANELNGGHFVFTAEFFDATSVSLLGLAISIWVFASQEKLRKLSSYCFPTLLAAINEPFLFALPIVLNPLLLIPYLLAPMLNVYVGYLAIHWDIVPLFRYTVESCAPVFLQGWLATGDVMGAVLQLVWLSLDIVIYTPFVIIFNLLTQDDDWLEEVNAHEA